MVCYKILKIIVWCYVPWCRDFGNIFNRVYAFVDRGKGAASWGLKCCELWVSL